MCPKDEKLPNPPSNKDVLTPEEVAKLRSSAASPAGSGVGWFQASICRAS